MRTHIPLPYSELEIMAHTNTRVVHAATLALLRDGENGIETLLTLRPQNFRSYANKYVLTGGKKEEGEDYLSCAVRETQEEVSIEVHPAHVIFLLQKTVDHYEDGQFHVMSYAARMPENQQIVPNEEVEQADWMTAQEAFAKEQSGEIKLTKVVRANLREISKYNTIEELYNHHSTSDSV